jgi:CHAT domain-containing protein/Tfp pilus assembly protein PilF
MIYRILLFVFISILSTPGIRSGTLSEDSTDVRSSINKAEAFFQSEDYDSALVYYKSANRQADKADDINTLVRSFSGIGATYIRNAQHDSAYVYLTEGIQLAERHLSPHDTLLAGLYQNIGIVYRNNGETDLARDYYMRALGIYESRPDMPLRVFASLYNNLGVLYFHEGLFDSSLVYLKKATHIRTELYGIYHRLTGESYRNIAITYNRRGKIDSAIEYQQKAVSIFTEIYGESDPRVAESYSGLGYYRSLQGDNTIGLEYQYKALSIYEGILKKPDNRVAAVYNSIGIIQHNIKEYEAAEKSYTISMEIRKEVVDENDITLANLNNNFGVLYTDMERYEEAIAAQLKALRIELLRYGEQHPSIAATYNNLGYTYLRQKSFDISLDYLNRAEQIASELYGQHHPFLARVYNNIGTVYEEKGELRNALTAFQKAIVAAVPSFTDLLTTANPEGKPSLSDELLLTALLGKAKLLEKVSSQNNGRLDELYAAFESYQSATEVIRRAMTVIRTDDSKISLSEKAHEVYEGGIRTAWELHKATGGIHFLYEAFRLAEANKSTVLWQVITDSNARSFADIPDSLLRRENDLRRDISYYESEMLKSETGSDRHTRFSGTLVSLKTQYDRLIDRIEREYPSYYELKHAASVPDIEDIRKELPPNTALIQYFVGINNVYIFAVTPDTFLAVRTDEPDRMSGDVSSILNALKMIDPPAFYRYASELYGKLLHPVDAVLDKVERLYIIPDGSLFYLPFETLIKKEFHTDLSVNGSSLIPYVIHTHEIAYHYSVRFLLRSLKRTNRTPEIKSFAGFAPVFSDPRPENTVLASQTSADISRLTSDEAYRSVILDTGDLAPLPHSREEIRTIASLFGQYGLPASTYLYTYASEETFKSVAAEYTYLHIASHGVLHESNPRFSGIIFAPPASAGAGEDGILFGGEMFNLTLNADLIVLSSCESGTGDIVKGEGLLAMTRGLLYSGASNLIVSLWKVYDRHTHNLMIEFYRNVLDGSDYSEALRHAKLRMIETETNSFPLFWSGFILIGGV